MSRSKQTTYGVRGLTCARCLMIAIEELRRLPGVRTVAVDLVPFGESTISVAPAGVASVDQVRDRLHGAGFELTGRRRRAELASHPARPLAGNRRVGEAACG